MKLVWTLSLLAVLPASDFGQSGPIELTADKLVSDAAQVQGVGHARARIGPLVLQADEATWRRETGELEMRGHVHVTLPAREDHTVVRYQAAVLLTDQPIGLTADQAAVRNGRLEASGNIVIVPVDPELPKVQLRGDELSMKLETADATLRGRVRASGIPEPQNDPLRRAYRAFPPDIIR